jgi:hypothetical protein
MTYTAFFGDGEKTFAFPSIELIQELERKTGHGIVALFSLIRNNGCSYNDLVEVIRLGLIGGGTTPPEADALVKTYAIARPIGESLAVALGILAALFFGTEEKSEAGE